VFEPLVGTLLRRELGIRVAAANGDTVTPVLARVATQEWEWTRAWSGELARFLTADPTHGEANRACIDAWIAEWRPQALEAALALKPLADSVPGGVDVEQAIARALDEAEHAVPSPDAAPVAPRGPRTRPVASRRARTSDAEGGTYDYVGIVMAKSAEGDAVAAVLAQRDDVDVIEQPSFWDIRAAERLTISYGEVSEQLGYEIGAYSIQHEMSTHYGRMITSDDALMLFSDPTEAMEHLMS
jgi:propane monooxygenase coupling protein